MIFDSRFVLGVSGKSGHGKDAIADYLVTHYGFRKIALADEVKRIALEEFGWDGKKDVRGRRLLQVIGTECGREYDEDIWVKKLHNRIQELEGPFVVPDVRFPNEAGFVSGHGALIRVRRPNFDGLPAGGARHPSETSLDDWPFVYVILNNSGLEELYRGVEEVLMRIEEVHT